MYRGMFLWIFFFVGLRCLSHLLNKKVIYFFVFFFLKDINYWDKSNSLDKKYIFLFKGKNYYSAWDHNSLGKVMVWRDQFIRDLHFIYRSSSSTCRVIKLRWKIILTSWYKCLFFLLISDRARGGGAVAVGQITGRDSYRIGVGGKHALRSAGWSSSHIFNSWPT